MPSFSKKIKCFHFFFKENYFWETENSCQPALITCQQITHIFAVRNEHAKRIIKSAQLKMLAYLHRRWSASEDVVVSKVEETFV